METNVAIAPTPLAPQRFFTGRWVGQGVVRANLLLRWLIPTDRVQLTSEAEWHDVDQWTVRDRMEFTSGQVMERTMEARLVAADRVEISAPDMPKGAVLSLHADRFVFSPYLIDAKYNGRSARLRCKDANVLTGPNTLRDTVRMYWGPIPLITMTLDLKIER